MKTLISEWRKRRPNKSAILSHRNPKLQLLLLLVLVDFVLEEKDNSMCFIPLRFHHLSCQKLSPHNLLKLIYLILGNADKKLLE